eukprot:jgi/Tetstr1/442228/TSEL_030369.t1
MNRPSVTLSAKRRTYVIDEPEAVAPYELLQSGGLGYKTRLAQTSPQEYLTGTSNPPTMSFIIDAARKYIANNMMESPRERDRMFDEHVRKTKQGAELTKLAWSQPTRTWGYWNENKSNMVYHFHLDPAFKKAIGRVDPVEQQLSK